MLAHDWLNGLRGFPGVVKGNGGDVVMQHVCFNDTVKEMSPNKTKVAVNRRRGTASKRPFFAVVMSNGRVGMLKIGDCHEPMINPDIGDKVPDKQIPETKG